MSRTASPEAISFADRLRDNETIARRFAEQAEELAAVKEDLARLKAVQPAPKPETMSDRLRAMNAKDASFLKQFQEQVDAQRKADEEARRKEKEEKLREIRSATKSPSLEAISLLVGNVSTLISADAYGSSEAREQERMVWPRWCALVDAWLPLRTLPIRGWDVSTGKAIKALTEAVETLARWWGWNWSLVPDAHRGELYQERVGRWEARWTLVERREALRWQTAFELGKADRPDSHVMQLAEQARAAGMPTPNLPSFIDKQPAGTRMSERVDWASLLWREMARNKRTDPALGGGPPRLNEEQRTILQHHVMKLQASLPGAEPQRGYVLDGHVVMPSNGSFVAPVMGGFLVHESQKPEVSRGV